MKAHIPHPYLALARAVVSLAIADGDWRFLCSAWGEELVDSAALHLTTARDALAEDIARAMGDKSWLDERTARVIVRRRFACTEMTQDNTYAEEDMYGVS